MPALVILGMLMLAFGWVGFLASDDWSYADAARRWLDGGPYLTNHFDYRYPHVAPIALSFALLGITEFSLVLPTTIYFLALLVLTYACVTKAFGRCSGLVCVGLLCTTPLFIELATIAGPSNPEVFYIAASIFLFYFAAVGEYMRWMLFSAGVAAGLAWVTRETTAGLILAYVICFFRGYRYSRSAYLFLVLGFAVVFASELGALISMTGDPLTRFRADIGHNKLGNPSHAPPFLAGNIGWEWAVDRLRGLLFHKSALVVWLAIPASFHLLARRQSGFPAQDLAALLLVVGITSFLMTGYVLGLASDRYFLPSTYVAIILVSLWVTRCLMVRSYAGAALLVAVLLASNIAVLYLSNRDPLYAERALLRFVATTSETVYTDPATAKVITFFLEEAHLEGRVSGEAPPPGSLYFYNERRVARGSGYGTSFEPARYTPAKTWREVWRFDPDVKVTSKILTWLRLDRMLPRAIVAKLNPLESVSVLRAP